MSLITDAETLAINTLTFIASQVGETTLKEVIEVVTGSGTQVLAEDISILVGGIAASVIASIGPDKTRSAMAGIFATADSVIDKIEDAKFPK